MTQEARPIFKMPPITRENLLAMRRGLGSSYPITLVKDAYLKMAAMAKYRPEAPSDGWGHIMLDDDQLNDPVRLEMEAWLAARKWYEDDYRHEFIISGCSDARLAKTMYLALQAAQLCCSGPNPCIKPILEMAIKALPREGSRSSKIGSER